MNKTNPEILREIERVLEKKLSALSGEEYMIQGGIDNIAEILNNSDRTTERTIIESLEENYQDIADAIRKKLKE